ncbi:Aste57867_1451 [Aphanomyces stellatus]|uniref:Tafazzin family protein n=1 Tax=Aphanomyces stellatus TaxID=120398 RepID=A0A485K8L0_9STRA|nr:hypothetical protein As57867_001450 [Aphanomyces stellatus]VFT78668.1 Aste57867_1451 [Aphanomyces stellatus]
MAVRQIMRVAGIGAGTAVGVGTLALFLDSPIADTNDEVFRDYRAAHPVDRFPQFVSTAARALLFYPTTLVAKVYLGKLNHFTSRNEETLEKWVLSRPDHRALITVTNHSSTVDDPAVLATMLSWTCAQPHLSRWSICSQEYCYAKGPLLSTVFFGSKTLPIKRGAGINHPFLQDLFQKVQDGDWVHVFPEGKIVQGGALGGRDGPTATTIGRLKWGVGKLIARADVTPVVLPIYHLGMDHVMPQTQHHKLRSIIPRTGQRVHALVGDPIYFDDLFQKYEADRRQGISGDGYTWDSDEQEKKLYSAITRRIELALLALEKKCYADLHAMDAVAAAPIQ